MALRSDFDRVRLGWGGQIHDRQRGSELTLGTKKQTIPSLHLEFSLQSLHMEFPQQSLHLELSLQPPHLEFPPVAWRGRVLVRGVVAVSQIEPSTDFTQGKIQLTFIFFPKLWALEPCMAMAKGHVHDR